MPEKESVNSYGFCPRCGAGRKPEPTGLYDTSTGEPKTRLVCSESPCVCNGHLDDGTPETFGRFLRHIFTGFTGNCRRCGAPMYLED
jgi:hypothetical protein